MERSESSSAYLERLNINTLMEWLTSSCILHRPEDPLEHCYNIIKNKLEMPYRQPYNKQYAANYLEESYKEALEKADEYGIIRPSNAKKKRKDIKQEENVRIEDYIFPLCNTILEMSDACSQDSVAKGMVNFVAKVFKAEQAGLFLLQRSKKNTILNENGIPSLTTRSSLVPGKGILGSVLTPGSTPILIPNTSENPLFIPIQDQLEESLTKSMICGGVFSPDGSPIGVLAVGNRAGGDVFLESEMYLFQSVLSLVSAFWGLASHWEKHEKEGVKFQSIMAIIEATYEQDLGMSHMMYIISACLPKVCNADKCTTFIVSRDRKELWTVQGDVKICMPIDKGIAGAVAQYGKTLNISNAYEDSRFNKQVDLDTGYQTRSILGVPISSSQGEVLGVVQLVNKLDHSDIHGGAFSKQDEVFLTTFLGILAPFIESSPLFRSYKSKDWI